MKSVLFICLFTLQLFSYEDHVDSKTAFEMLLFKTGVSSLSKDFEIEQENIQKNTNDIETLKKQVQYLLNENMKLKLHANSDNFQAVKSKVVIKKYLSAKIYDLKASSVEHPYPNSAVKNVYFQGDIIQIEFCNKYGWCKLKNKNEYIAKYKIVVIKD